MKSALLPMTDAQSRALANINARQNSPHMTEEQMIARVAKANHLSKAQVRAVVNGMLDAMEGKEKQTC